METQSGNPGGRPKDEHRVAELARSYTVEAIDTLVELMPDGKDERIPFPISLTNTPSFPAAQLINNILGALNRAQPITKTVPKRMYDAALWHQRLKPLVQPIAGIVRFITGC